jgi:hypothetical protein
MPILQREQCFSRPIRTIRSAESPGVRTLDIPLQRQGDAHFHKSVVTEIAAGTPQKPMDWSARRTSTPAACRSDQISAELRRSCGEVSSYARRRRPRTASTPFVVGHSQPANRCRSWFCVRNLKSRCDFGAVRQVARIMSSGGRPGRSPLLRRASTDNGPDRPDAMRSLVFERPPASTAGFVSVGERRVLRRSIRTAAIHLRRGVGFAPGANASVRTVDDGRQSRRYRHAET